MCRCFFKTYFTKIITNHQFSTRMWCCMRAQRRTCHCFSRGSCINKFPFLQEKYLSENYSEAHDSDAARRLLEFGEDYRCFFDSQSDCWSSNSVKREYSPQLRRKPQHLLFQDSDSEIEDVKNAINDSKAQLCYTRDIYNKHVAMGFGEFLLSSDCVSIYLSLLFLNLHCNIPIIVDDSGRFSKEVNFVIG